VMRNDICTTIFENCSFPNMKLLASFFLLILLKAVMIFLAIESDNGRRVFHGEVILCLSEVTVIVLCTDAVFDAALGGLFTLLFEKRRI